MKRQTGITLDIETHHKIGKKLRYHHFRSKGHLIERAVLEFLKRSDEDE